MRAQDVIQAVGDEPARAYAAGPGAVRHVIEAWATRALLAEEKLADVERELEDFRRANRGRLDT